MLHPFRIPVAGNHFLIRHYQVILIQAFFIPRYSHTVCILINYLLYRPMIPTQTLCTTVSTITKQNINVETLQILEFCCRYPLPLRQLVTLSYLLKIFHLHIGFIFELSQLVLCTRLHFLSQIRDSSDCLNFRQHWYIHSWIQRYSQIIWNRNHYLHQVLVQLF